MGKYTRLVEKILNEMPLQFSHEERPLVKDWEPTKWPVQWEREVAQNGKYVMVQGKGQFGVTIIGLFDISDPTDPKYVVGTYGALVQLKEDGMPFGKAFKMIEVATAKGERGKGIGTMFHEMLIKHFGAIASDNALFSTKKNALDGIVGIWLKKLPKKYTVRIYDEEEDNFVGPVGKKLDNKEETFLVASKY
jgi:hypothetical protein